MCGICGKLDKNSLCKKCELNLKQQAVFGTNNYIDDEEKFFDEHFYIFLYEGVIRKNILNYKFKDKSYLYKTFSTFLFKNLEFIGKLKTYDVIIAIPISSKRKKERGYNQSILIAKEISKFTEKKIVTNCLYKVKNIVPQSGLNKQERKSNIKGAYSLCNNELIKDKKVLLVDDIYTTGSTVNECSKILKDAEASKIGVFTLAKD